MRPVGQLHSLGYRRIGGAEALKAARGKLNSEQTAVLADLWDVLFDDLLTLDVLARVTAPVHVVEGSQTSAVDHAICDDYVGLPV